MSELFEMEELKSDDISETGGSFFFTWISETPTMNIGKCSVFDVVISSSGMSVECEC